MFAPSTTKIGVACIACDGSSTTVIDSRPRMWGRYRRHQCDKCAKRFNTFELHESYLKQLGFKIPIDPYDKQRKRK